MYEVLCCVFIRVVLFYVSSAHHARNPLFNPLYNPPNTTYANVHSASKARMVLIAGRVARMMLRTDHHSNNSVVLPDFLFVTLVTSLPLLSSSLACNSLFVGSITSAVKGPISKDAAAALAK